MSAWSRRLVVSVLSPRVEDMLIGQPLDVSNIQDHVELVSLACFFEDLERF